jgi:hypothetical protein
MNKNDLFIYVHRMLTTSLIMSTSLWLPIEKIGHAVLRMLTDTFETDKLKIAEKAFSAIISMIDQPNTVYDVESNSIIPCVSGQFSGSIISKDVTLCDLMCTLNEFVSNLNAHINDKNGSFLNFILHFMEQFSSETTQYIRGDGITITTVDECHEIAERLSNFSKNAKIIEEILKTKEIRKLLSTSRCKQFFGNDEKHLYARYGHSQVCNQLFNFYPCMYRDYIEKYLKGINNSRFKYYQFDTDSGEWNIFNPVNPGIMVGNHVQLVEKMFDRYDIIDVYLESQDESLQNKLLTIKQFGSPVSTNSNAVTDEEMKIVTTFSTKYNGSFDLYNTSNDIFNIGTGDWMTSNEFRNKYKLYGPISYIVIYDNNDNISKETIDRLFQLLKVYATISYLPQINLYKMG